MSRKPTTQQVRGGRMDGLTPDLIAKLEAIQAALQLSSLRSALRYAVRMCPMPNAATKDQ